MRGKKRKNRERSGILERQTPQKLTVLLGRIDQRLREVAADARPVKQAGKVTAILKLLTLRYKLRTGKDAT